MIVMVSNSTGFDAGLLAGLYPGKVGHLFAPGGQRGPWDGVPYALDNGAWPAFLNGHEWNEDEWRRLLRWAAIAGPRPLWALVADVVGQREETIARWHQYVDVVRSHEFRPAFALQEPTDHDIKPLLRELRSAGYSTALATSGVRRVIPPVDWLSVSPHTPSIVQRFGSEIKLVDGLGDIDLERWHAANPDDSTDFMNRYVQPLTIGGVESKSSLERCLAFLKTRPNWSLSRQDHRHWGVA